MSDIKEQELVEEQKLINELVQMVNQKEVKLKQKNNKISSDVLEIKTTFWNDVTINMDEPDDIIETYYSIKQQSQLLSERERTRGIIDKQLNVLNRLKNSPYFGRIDFLEDGENITEKIYIGIASLMDKKDENFLIYDWRAPISSMYYDYSPGPANYETPSGEFNGEIKLKRQYIIRNAKLKAMFDTGVTIGDEMLQEVLANQADTQMKSIVATIQKEQNQIIRNEKAKLLVVQGVAGSGKTSAALQRVAYLLYRYRGKINSENIMLFSPNTLFNSYVATVLPELGEENMKQTTFQEYLNSRIHRECFLEDAYDQMEYLLTTQQDEEYETRMESIRYKASLEFKQLIDQHGENLKMEGMIFQNVVFRRKILVTKEEIYQYFYNIDPAISIPNKIELVRNWLMKELKKSMKLEQSEDWVQEEIQYLDKEDYLEAFNTIEEKDGFSKESFNDFDREEAYLAQMVVKQRFKRLFNSVKKLRFVNLLDMYKRIFMLENNTLKWNEISKFSVKSLNDMNMTYEDATPFVYLQDLILGRNSDTAIRHVFIDEAQDYSPFQFSFIQQLFPFSKMTLLGDINQAIYSGVTNSETVLEGTVSSENETETIILTKTYRSTKPIVEFTRGLIDNGEKIEAFNRPGKKPTLKVINDFWELEKNLIIKVQSLQENGYKTIAIICKTAKESKMAYDSLKNEMTVRLIEKGTLAYEEGTLIIPAYLAKGIEFDAVIIFDTSQYARDEERKLFYTACTRAMHELHLFSIETRSPLLKLIPEDAFEII
ncbi:RNA polymerase recycling motor HelD [Pseudoneobacillus rhizosphaerae]|uniref:DNA helicase IV n=1 Tax=Pseudoneobacillus rhizosphaerae TaxID=2880968 RepID=A0A9C7GAR8_9BACI|nr:RNA polymerase recycling motor HelD [Pseudoneobacillus rhizosphaerae]CAG9608770.1 DNA helicase IV [Pseudoneobacillus rhizosphaerae]